MKPWPLVNVEDLERLRRVRKENPDLGLVRFGGLWRPKEELEDTYFQQMLSPEPGKSWYDVRGALIYQADRIQEARNLIGDYNDTFLDVGSYIGAWAWVLAKDFRKVVMFEPVPRFVEACRLNLKRVPNIILNRMAVADVPGTAYWRIPKGVMSAYITEMGPSLTLENNPVKKVTLDMLRGKFGIVSLMKIDVEGMESLVLLGGQYVINRDHPVIVLEQKLHGYRYGEQPYTALKMLIDWGYEIRRLVGHDFYLSYRG